MRAVPRQRSCTRAQTPRASWSSAARAAPAKGTEPKLAERIAKRLSRSGVCSRRIGEEWVREGRIRVDGEVVRDPATCVTSAQKVKAGPMRLWIHNKKPGVTVTERDEHAAIPLIPTLQKLGLPRLQPVGRLDINSEGLLLLTNDGELKQALERSSLKRKYRVRVRGEIPRGMPEELLRGVTVEGVHYAPIEMSSPNAAMDSTRNQWVSITLQEGKNREIRRVMQSYGLQISRLIRTQFGPYTLDELEAGATREVEIKSAVKRSLRKLRDGKLDLRSLDALQPRGNAKRAAAADEGEDIKDDDEDVE